MCKRSMLSDGGSVRSEPDETTSSAPTKAPEALTPPMAPTSQKSETAAEPKSLSSTAVPSQQQQPAASCTDRRVSITLIGITLASYALLVLLVMVGDLPRVPLGEVERQATLIVTTLHAGSLLSDVLTKQQLGDAWLRRSILVVKVAAAATNTILLTSGGTPFVVDPVTQRPNCMLRWAEWTVLAGTMTFLVESADGTHVRTAILSGASQSASTGLGMLLPLCPPVLWGAVLTLSFVLYFVIFTRLRDKEAARALARSTLPASSLERRRAELGARLMWQCTATWTVLVAVWCVDAAVRLTLPPTSWPATDWAYIADCVIDVVAKMLYSSSIQEQTDAGAVRYQQDSGQAAEETMRVLWSCASDVLVVSQQLGGEVLGGEAAARPRVVTCASPSVGLLFGGCADTAAASEWVRGKVHELGQPTPCSAAGAEADGSTRASLLTTEALQPTVACENLEELVSFAWHRQSADSRSQFTCSLCLHACTPSPPQAELPTTSDDGGGGGEMRKDLHLFEVMCSKHDDMSETCSLVVVLRDVTDKVRLLNTEKQILATQVAREKDEEANRFTRHEVKNSVLAALANCNELRKTHQLAASEGKVPVEYIKPIDEQLTHLSSGLNQTLETCLSQAMASEVVHGVYVARTLPVRVDAELQAALDSGDAARFPIVTRPAQLPIVDTDPSLLRHIYRNAISNACKYGRRNGVVRTEVELQEHLLVLRVINERGESHEALQRIDPALVFKKGTRFHSDHRNAVSSKGDGAWIMQQCAACLQGSCTLRFGSTHTTFELRCPAPVRLDDGALSTMVSLGEHVWAMGVDDCDFQRLVLEQMFASVGVPPERTSILGETAEQIERLDERIIEQMRSLPLDAKLLVIVDENLDLPEACFATISGSASVQKAREQLTAVEDARLLSLIRSSNDSHTDVSIYLERAHGFLPKAPTEPEARAIQRCWVRRFGMPKGGTAMTPLVAAAETQSAAAAELQKVTRLVNCDLMTMSWTELWKWLHRIKGIVATTMSAMGGELAMSKALIAEIESLRTLGALPADVSSRWAKVLAMTEHIIDEIARRT